MKTIIRSFAVIICFFVFGTVTGYGQSVRPDSLGTYIEFGSGGGFAGAKHGYLLTEKGLLFSTQQVSINDLNIAYIKKIKKSQTQALFRSTQRTALSGLTFNEPGNTYSYIHYITDYLSYKYTWGNPGKPAPKKLLKLFRQLEKTTTL